MAEKSRVILLALLLSIAKPLGAQEATGQEDSLVRLQNAQSLELIEKDGRQYRKAIDATFLHAGTYLICDTALWNVDRKLINAYGNVKLIQGETELSSDQLDYYVDQHLAQFRGQVVQLRNKENNILRTKFLDYNTQDSVATFHNGAAMKDAEGQVIESLNGTYESALKRFTFSKKVNMYTDSTFVKTKEMVYRSDSSIADFTSPIEFWHEDNMLSAAGGWYNREKELFFFHQNVHALSREQEAWCDTMYFYRPQRNVRMYSRAQIQDTVHNSYALADYVFYQDSTSTLRMEKNAAVALVSQEKGKRPDTLYFGGDTLILRTFMKFEIPEEEIKVAEERKTDIMMDPVMEYRRKAAEEAAKAAAEKIKNDPNRPHPLASDSTAEQGKVPEVKPQEVAAPPEENVSAGDKAAGAGSPTAESGNPAVASDTMATAAPDSLMAGLDSLVAVDSLAVADSLATADSLVVPKDSTKINFVTGIGRVRAFRKDIQVLCDSLRYCDLDSIARFYIDPVVWNDGNRQYTSDSLFILVNSKGIDRAALMSNAFIITQEDSLYYDQIKSTDVVAYFDTTSALRRFDALGGATAMFMLQENGSYATVNKVETKMMSALFEDGELSRVFYFDSPKNNATPIAQMSSSELLMKDFKWRADERPKGPEDITTLTIRPSQRAYYESRPKARFEETDKYFPGYMASVYAGLEQARIRKKQRKLAEGSPNDTTALQLVDSLAVADSLGAVKDSLAVIDSVAVDTVAVAAVAAVADSLGKSPADSVSAAAAAVTTVAAVDVAAQKAAARQARRQQAEKEKAERIAKREAKWAALDSLDHAKALAKEQKKLDKKREKIRAAYLRQQRQDQKDKLKLDKFVEKYRKKRSKEIPKQVPKKPEKQVEEALTEIYDKAK